MPASADADKPEFKMPASGSPIHVNGDAVEYLNNEQKVVGTGNVSINYDGTVLKADKITVYLEPKRAVAEGNVTLTQNGSEFKGGRGEYDFKNKIGNVSGMTGEIKPSYFIKAKSVERQGEDHFRTTDSYLTTCCGDKPLYQIKARQVDVYPNEKVSMRDAFILVHGVPVLWVPFMETYFVDFKRFPVQIIPGKTSDWGAFILSKWRYHLVEEQDLSVRGNILADWRERRGFGGGSELFYRGDKVGRGVFRGYYLKDGEPPIEADNDRYRGQWRHQADLTPDTTLTVDINKTSDKDFIKDFFYREEYEREVAPDNYISLIKNNSDYTLSALERIRLNDFYTAVERAPQVKFDTHTQPLGQGFYLRQQAQFDNLKTEFKDPGDDIDTVRGDLYHTLSYAGHAGPVSIVPRVGLRETLYSRDKNGDDSHFRTLADLGVDVSTHFYKTYDVYIDSFGLDINQVRHLFNPTLSTNFRGNPNLSRTKIHQFDEIDAFDKENIIRVDLINKLQTKEHTGVDGKQLEPRDLARIVPFFEADMRNGHWQNAGLDVELRPYSWMGIEGDALYDTNTNDVTQANVDVYFTRGDFRFALGQRYSQNESSQMTVDAQWKINPEWDLRVYERFEFEDSTNREFEATVSKTWSCVITDLTYNHRPDDDTIYFIVRLKAFPDASFKLSQSYNRPKGSSQPASRYI